jgi:DNA helicase II / ATP-dependent DNA helicase PcrA
VDTDRILGGLNEEQRDAARSVRGPVAIMAGAGTGKTTAITHRIAYQVATGTFPADRLLAVTFTERAARELKRRLAALGVDGVDARTFHSAAFAQLRWLWPADGAPLPEVLDHKAPLIAPLAKALPPPHRFLPRSELAGEIEWAKNRMVSPSGYLDELDRTGHEPPIPAELMLRVFDGYERRRSSAGRMDFEDMLGLAVRMLSERPEAAAAVRERFHAFTVDEFQDVNPLQAALLDGWLGERDDVCVVGDDYQTIYTFTGASPEHLLGFTTRFPRATLIRLRRNYRSSPQVLEFANKLVPHLGGFEKTLEATQPPGPEPVALGTADHDVEVAAVVQAVGRLRAEGTALERIAVLYRINARSEPFEEAFAAAGIAYQVRDGAFLRRPGPRAALQRLRRGAVGAVVDVVAAVTDALGYDPEADPDADEEITRQADLSRLRVLAAEFAEAHPAGELTAFVAELRRRFSPEHEGRGVILSTYHRAKGLEFDAVFLPRLTDGELPFRSGRAKADPVEERRLLYVGITRARRYLFLTWHRDPKTSPSPFLAELGVRTRPPRPARRTSVAVPVGSGGALFDRLKAWRRSRAEADGVPPYVVFHDRTLAQIAERKPLDRDDLAGISGVGPTKIERYADEVLGVVAGG